MLIVALKVAACAKLRGRMLNLKPGPSTPMDEACAELGWQPRLTLAEGKAQLRLSLNV